MKSRKFLYIVIAVPLIFFQDTIMAQSNAPDNKPQIRLNHIAVYVNNLEESSNFYEDVLGLTQIPEPFKDGRHTWFTLGEGGQLHLIQGAKKGIVHDKNAHLCFSVESIDDFVQNLDQHNIDRINWAGDSKEPTLRVDGVKQIYFQDPDGYWLEVNDDFE